MSDTPAPDSHALEVPQHSQPGDTKFCRLCPHSLILHSGLHVTCVLCPDHHGFVYRIPPPQPVVFMSESEAQERLAALKAQEGPGLPQATGPVSPDVWRVPPGTEAPRRHYGAMPPGRRSEAQEGVQEAVETTQAEEAVPEDASRAKSNLQLLASCYGPDAYARCQCGHTYGWHSGVGRFQCDFCWCTRFRQKEEDSVTPVVPAQPATDLAQSAPCMCGHPKERHVREGRCSDILCHGFLCPCRQFMPPTDVAGISNAGDSVAEDSRTATPNLQVREATYSDHTYNAPCMCQHIWIWHGGPPGGKCVWCPCARFALAVEAPCQTNEAPIRPEKVFMLTLSLDLDTVREAQTQVIKGPANPLEQLGWEVITALDTQYGGGTS